MHGNFGVSFLLNYLCIDPPSSLELLQVEGGSVVVDSLISGDKTSGFKSYLWHLVLGWPVANNVTSPGLSFFTYKMG